MVISDSVVLTHIIMSVIELFSKSDQNCFARLIYIDWYSFFQFQCLVSLESVSVLFRYVELVILYVSD